VTSLRLDQPFRWGRTPEQGHLKAVTAVGGWTTAAGSLRGNTEQERAAAYLRAYKVGWFYKAGRKIAEDIASLDWSVSDGDMEEGEDETTLDRPQLSIPFEALSPIDQFQRLLERPNPRQTGRQLFRKTEVRLDFAGCAAWYLEGGAFGLPTAIYGISPSRMWPSYDRTGQMIGWVMDKDSPSGGVPFETSEILWFSVGNADDDDLFGTSVVESVFTQVPLTEMMARHTVNVLATGGRLAGMLSPKERALSENEFDDAVRAWRNVASDPDAARRLLIFPEPMEYTPGASTPAEIGIPELAVLTRDEILTAFPVSPYRLGVPAPGGLNSGEVRREDRRDYWEETIHPRADLFEEVIQVGLLSRYEEILGQTFNFEINEPNLDDAPSLIEKVGAFKGLVSVGFDPKESVGAVGLSGIKWIGLPAILDPAKQLQMQGAAAPKEVGGVTVGTGDTSRMDGVDVAVPIAKSVKPRGEDSIRTFLTEQRERLTERVRDSLPTTKAARKDAADHWWDGAAEDAALRETLRGLYVEVGREGLQVVADKLGRVVTSPSVNRIVMDLMEYGGVRITEINERTRDAVKAQLTEGTRRGYSIPQLLGGVEAESYAGVQGALLDNGVPVFDAYRAEMISRTETALSYNRAAIRGYSEFGVRQVQAIDGDGDAECAARNGMTLTVDEALAITDHPNGTLDWVPVLA
jgi:phage portal protein BeeE